MTANEFYTFNQFYTVIYYTILIMVTIVIYGYYYYRIARRKRLISFAAIALLTSFLFAMLKYIAVTISSKFILAVLSYFLGSLHLFLILFILAGAISQKKLFKTWKGIYASLSYLMIIFLYILGYGEYFFISAWMLFNFVFIIKPYLNEGMSLSIFTSVNKSLVNYIFVVGEDGEVFYTNNAVKNSGIFEERTNIDVGNLASLFKAKVSIRRINGNEFIKFEADEPRYFAYSKKKIHPKDVSKTRNGIILTFTDLTKSIAMIDDLAKHSEEVRKANIALKDKKGKVYELEKEREITHLLDKVANDQYKAMKELKVKIEELDTYSNSFDKDLSELIVLAQSDLKLVRETVSSYKNV